MSLALKESRPKPSASCIGLRSPPEPSCICVCVWCVCVCVCVCAACGTHIHSTIYKNPLRRDKRLTLQPHCSPTAAPFEPPPKIAMPPRMRRQRTGHSSSMSPTLSQRHACQFQHARTAALCAVRWQHRWRSSCHFSTAGATAGDTHAAATNVRHRCRRCRWSYHILQDLLATVTLAAAAAVAAAAGSAASSAARPPARRQPAR